MCVVIISHVELSTHFFSSIYLIFICTRGTNEDFYFYGVNEVQLQTSSVCWLLVGLVSGDVPGQVGLEEARFDLGGVWFMFSLGSGRLIRDRFGPVRGLGDEHASYLTITCKHVILRHAWCGPAAPAACSLHCW